MYFIREKTILLRIFEDISLYNWKKHMVEYRQSDREMFSTLIYFLDWTMKLTM